MKIKFTVSLMLILAFAGLILIFAANSCPVGGDNSKPKFQHLDSLKNRSLVSKHITNVALETVMKPGDDTHRFADSQYVSITGFIYKVKWGGAETCNCHSKDKSQLDFHVELVTTLDGADNSKAMVVEVSRFSRGHMTYESIKSLEGKKVTVNGWLFFDEEHKQNAVNTNPKGTNLYRATVWEIHPVFSISEVK